jgi:Ricin-type beta-trefoil lectin domain
MMLPTIIQLHGVINRREVPVPGQTGSAQIHAQARPDLCWQAAGNGSPVTLEHCGSAEGQQWTLAGHGVLTNGVLTNGVLMNGNGYCLQAGPTLAIGFDGQCDGQAGQLWTYRGTTGQLMNTGQGDCAVLGGPLVPGTPVVSGACAGGTRWSLGSGVIPVEPAVPARPQAAPGRVVVHPATVLPAAGSGTGASAAAGGGLLLAALLAGLLLITGATLVYFGRRSRRAGRSRPSAHPAVGPAAGAPDDGPYVVDVTGEVAQRQRAQGEVDARPTQPFDVSSLR